MLRAIARQHGYSADFKIPTCTKIKSSKNSRDLLKAPEKFEEGFGWKSVIGALFIGFLMMPGSMYLGLVVGTGIGPAARWVTVILFGRSSQASLHPFETAVREGCLIEEDASGVHCVGIKQTILFPFVTLGSLINFCDCLMAGGTSRKDHSEVGSSYIHFNFTPDGDKTTPSLIGDVPRGVMLRERPVFLGGQGGMVGPLRVGYGNVIAAGAILRSDVTEENKLVVRKSYKGSVTNFTPNQYSGLSRLVSSNVLYLANLLALEEWYTQVRRDFFHKQEFGEWIYQGAIEKLAMAKEERLSRLKLMAAKMSESVRRDKPDSASAARKKEFHEKIAPLCELFMEKPASPETNGKKEAFLRAFQAIGRSGGIGYIETIKSLPDQTAGKGTDWLQQIVADTCERAATLLPSLKLFRK